MTHSLDWNTVDFEFIACMIVLIFGFMTYFFVSKSHMLKNIFFKRFGEEKTKVNLVIFERIIGFILFGFLPFIVIRIINNESVCNYGLSSNNISTSMYWILGLSPILVVLNFLNCKKPDNLAMYPQIRKKEWNLKLILISAFSWTFYLLAYEFLFRGYLLFIFLKYLNIWAAISLNVAIYALVHVPKGHKEAIGAIPLGIVLGIITLKTGTIWVAFGVHVVLALSNEWLSLRAHPDMKFVKN